MNGFSASSFRIARQRRSNPYEQELDSGARAQSCARPGMTMCGWPKFITLFFLSPLPLWERVVSSDSEKPGEGSCYHDANTPHPPSLGSGTLSHKGRR